MIYDKLVHEKLPKWATIEKVENVKNENMERIVVQAEVVYPIFLKILGYPEKNITQVHLEICRFCFSEYLKTRIVQKYMDDFTPCILRIASESEREWALKNYPRADTTIPPLSDYLGKDFDPKVISIGDVLTDREMVIAAAEYKRIAPLIK
jgi:hypothetical protein